MHWNFLDNFSLAKSIDDPDEVKDEDIFRAEDLWSKDGDELRDSDIKKYWNKYFDSTNYRSQSNCENVNLIVGECHFMCLCSGWYLQPTCRMLVTFGLIAFAAWTLLAEKNKKEEEKKKQVRPLFLSVRATCSLLLCLMSHSVSYCIAVLTTLLTYQPVMSWVCLISGHVLFMFSTVNIILSLCAASLSVVELL